MEEVAQVNEYLEMALTMAIRYARGLALAIATLFFRLVDHFDVLQRCNSGF